VFGFEKPNTFFVYRNEEKINDKNFELWGSFKFITGAIITAILWDLKH